MGTSDKGHENITEQWLVSEYTKRARQIGLKVDCIGSGDVNAELVAIAEAPAGAEAQMKMPLVGKTGRYLWDELRKHDINRRSFWVTNVIKREVYIPSKDDGKSPITKQELEHWEGLLDWELDQLPNLKYVLVMGNYALHAIVGESGINKWRGSVFQCKVGRKQRVVTVLCTNNPANVFHDPTSEPMFKFDIKKLKLVLDGKWIKHVINATINPSKKEALTWIKDLRGEEKPIAYDIETMGGETACLGLANDPHRGICINFRDATKHRYSLSEEVEIRIAAQDMFNDRKLQFVAQSGNFDAYWLWYKDHIHVPRHWFDTLLAHHTLYPRMPHNLGYLTAQYTTHPFYKDEKDWREGGDINQFWEYNVKDACITLAVHVAELRELKAQHLDEFFFNHVMRITPHLVRMTVGGVKADIEMKDKLAGEFTEDLQKVKEDFWKIVQELTEDATCTPNLNSPKQIRDLFFSRLGLIGHGGSTGKANRDRIRLHPRTPERALDMLDLYDKFKTDDKFLGTYLNSKVDDDGRIRCEYKQFGVVQAPGRLSSSQTMWDSGMNLQNQPEKMYPMFVADEGYMFSYFDLSQAEARIVAYLWNVPALIENFERQGEDESFDVHRGNAARIFRIPYDDIPKNDRDENGKPTYRYLGKRCVHGLNYRMGPNKLAEVCGISLSQAAEAHASYHRAFPEIQRAWRDIITTCRKERMLFTPHGRRMIFLERITEDTLDSVVAYIPQSTIGDKVALCIAECHDHPDWPISARIALNIHDALIALHKPEDKEVVQRIMKLEAEKGIVLRGQEIIIPAEIKESMPGNDGVHRWSTIH